MSVVVTLRGIVCWMQTRPTVEVQSLQGGTNMMITRWQKCHHQTSRLDLTCSDNNFVLQKTEINSILYITDKCGTFTCRNAKWHSVGSRNVCMPFVACRIFKCNNSILLHCVMMRRGDKWKEENQLGVCCGLRRATLTLYWVVTWHSAETWRRLISVTNRLPSVFWCCWLGYLECKEVNSFTSNMGPMGGADLHSCSPQPVTSLYCIIANMGLLHCLYSFANPLTAN